MKGTPGTRPELKPSARQAPVRAIFLVGFMGAGKTSVGQALGRRLGWQFVDLDECIRNREARSIPEIFQERGEAYFRQIELQVFRELLAQAESGSLIVALGGGAFVQDQIASLLQQAGHVTVFLDASSDELWRRCGMDSVERPLRQQEAAFRTLYDTRRPRYLQSTMRVETGGMPIEQIVREIVSRLKLDRNSGEEK